MSDSDQIVNLRSLMNNPEIRSYLKNSERYQRSRRIGRIAIVAMLLLDTFGIVAIIYASSSDFPIAFGIAALIVSGALVPVVIKGVNMRLSELKKAREVLGITNERLHEGSSDM